MKHGATVAAFEREFAAYVRARYAIAMTNGTVTLEVALRALGIGACDRVATTPLTMAATSIAILNVGAVPEYRDVDAQTWLMAESGIREPFLLPVSLYGLHAPTYDVFEHGVIDDAAQTLRPHGDADFTSYSFQRSKILNTGEGGMLVTDDEALATAARSIASLGYDLSPKQSRIDSAAIKASDAVRHVRYPAMNARMNDATAQRGLAQLSVAGALKAERRMCADAYRHAIAGCSWITPQYVPEGWTHDYWCYAIACDTPEQARRLQNAVVRFGGERPYAAWRLTYHEPAFVHLAASCPVAESLQPRLLQFQTNDVTHASANAFALREAILELNG